MTVPANAVDARPEVGRADGGSLPLILAASRLVSRNPSPDGLRSCSVLPGAPIVMIVAMASDPVPMLRSCSPGPVPMLMTWQFELVPMSTSSAILVPTWTATESRLALSVPLIVSVSADPSVAVMCESVAFSACRFTANMLTAKTLEPKLRPAASREMAASPMLMVFPLRNRSRKRMSALPRSYATLAVGRTWPVTRRLLALREAGRRSLLIVPVVSADAFAAPTKPPAVTTPETRAAPLTSSVAAGCWTPPSPTKPVPALTAMPDPPAACIRRSPTSFCSVAALLPPGAALAAGPFTCRKTDRTAPIACRTNAFDIPATKASLKKYASGCLSQPQCYLRQGQ